ncbi:MAG TPA: hypothetical protein ENI27_03600 [bacterium]|nr:hypothetical protein [bacterium]
MATDQKSIYIFHIFRKDGNSLFLHPFSSVDKIVGQLENTAVIGRYGLEPRVEALTAFRNELYRQIEHGVKRWLSEARFVPKFIIAAVGFVLVYFFMSYVIPDPIPVIDEVAVGLAVAIGIYFLQGRRDMSSKMAAKKRLELRIGVDKIVFRESDFVKQVETALHRKETEQFDEVVRQIVEPVSQDLGDAFRSEADQFIRLLEDRFHFKSFKKKEKIFERYLGGSEERFQDLKRILEAKKLDFPMYAVYKSFKKTVSKPKRG